MSFLSKVGDFFFGRRPDIFDENGQVLHKHPKKKWDAWQNKFKTESSYNWRSHQGLQAGGTAKPRS